MGKISEGTTIGYKRLVRFDDVIADKLRVTINRTRADFSILRTGIFYANPIIEKSEEAQNSVFTPQECLIGDKEAVEAIDKKSRLLFTATVFLLSSSISENTKHKRVLLHTGTRREYRWDYFPL